MISWMFVLALFAMWCIGMMALAYVVIGALEQIAETDEPEPEKCKFCPKRWECPASHKGVCIYDN